MSEHHWTQDHIEAFVVGGLTADESDRLERHARDCSECAAELANTRRLDRGLGGLFAEVRADPGLEDRAVGSTRAAKRRVIMLSGFLPRLAVAAGVLLVLASIGALAGSLMDSGRLRLPGESFARSSSAEGLESSEAYAELATEKLRETLGKTQLSIKDYDGDIKKGLPASGPRSSGHGNTDAERQVAGDRNGRAVNEPAMAAQKQYAGFRAVDDFSGRNYVGGLTPGGGAISGGIGGGYGGGGGGGKPGTSALGTNLTLGFQPNMPPPTALPARPQTTAGTSAVVNGTVANGGLVVAPASPEAPSNGPGGPNVFYAMTTPPTSATKGEGKGDVGFRPDEHRPGVPSLQTDERSRSLAEDDSKVQQKFGEEKDKNKVGRKEIAGNNVAKQDPVAKPDVADPAKAPEAASTKRVVIRSGQMEFEVDSFDGATATLTKLVAGIPGAFVATVNSDKLANGKVRGSITVRVPPEHLDSLVLDLRRDLAKGGELKGMKIGAQDVTKQYTDTESRLRAARTMEQRLLQIIKEGKGEIKQLLQVEKELGEWRTKIEEFEGEIRYYSNLAALATLTVVLTEKEIRAAAAITENERVQAGVEVEDVDKAYQQVMEVVVAAKGRVTKSEVKQLGAGQLNAALQFAVPPESGGPVRDRLRQLGRLARLEIDRVQNVTGETTPDVKVKRGDTIFLVQLYNLANIQPRETVTLQIAAADVRAAFQALRDAGSKASVRVRAAQLNEQDTENVTAEYDVEVRRPEEGVLSGAVNAAGETMSRQITRAPEGDQFTDSKIAYRVSLIPVARLNPRETVGMQIAAADVRAAFQALRDAGAKASARVRTAQLNEQDAENVTAQYAFEVRRADEAAIQAALGSAGETVSRQVTRAPEAAGFTASKVLYSVAIIPADRLPPRETVTMTLVVPDVDQAAANFGTQVGEAKGRQVNAQSTRDRTGKVTSSLTYEVPLASAGLAERFKSAGTLREYQSVRNPQAPAGKLAIARFDVTLVSGEQILAADEGLWPQIRNGLSYSAKTLLVSVTWLIFGLCVVLPWLLVMYGIYRLVRRAGRPQPIVATQTTQS
jgi:hypothetical protein